MIIPKQAVILCGGQGSRLRPLTYSIPKPLAPIRDKPFLEYLLLQVAEQGINRFVLLTGYKGKMINKYFRDGSRWNWTIEYSHGPEDWDTGRRLWEARSLIDERFLLLYSDNYVQFNLEKLMNIHKQQKFPLSLVVAPKKQGNMKISANNKIEVYNKDRIGQGLNYVEVGYMIVERDYIISAYSNINFAPNISFSEIIHLLVQNNQIAGLIVNDPYHSISDMKRLALMREYLKPKKLLLIDRDGVINKKASEGNYITKWEDFEWIEDTFKSMKHLAKRGFSFIIITNQAGIARGMVCKKQLQKIHELMISYLASNNIKVHDVFVCPHHWNKNCYCRKPKPGLFFEISKKYLIRMDRTIYIGDDVRDVEAAYNAGCGSVLISSKSDVFIQKLPKWNIKVNKLSDALIDIELFMKRTNL